MNYAMIYCVWMLFEVDCVKLHHYVILEGLSKAVVPRKPNLL